MRLRKGREGFPLLLPVGELGMRGGEPGEAATERFWAAAVWGKP